MLDRPLIGAAAIVKKNGKVLIGKRKNIIGHGEWAFPGGHLEFGESFEECINREIIEEVGIKVKNIKLEAITNDIHPQAKTHRVTLFFTCDYIGGIVKNMEPHKCEGWEWAKWDFLVVNESNLFLSMQNLLKQNFNPFRN